MCASLITLDTRPGVLESHQKFTCVKSFQSCHFPPTLANILLLFLRHSNHHAWLFFFLKPSLLSFLVWFLKRYLLFWHNKVESEWKCAQQWGCPWRSEALDPLQAGVRELWLTESWGQDPDPHSVTNVSLTSEPPSPQSVLHACSENFGSFKNSSEYVFV